MTNGGAGMVPAGCRSTAPLQDVKRETRWPILESTALQFFAWTELTRGV